MCFLGRHHNPAETRLIGHDYMGLVLSCRLMKEKERTEEFEGSTVAFDVGLLRGIGSETHPRVLTVGVG